MNINNYRGIYFLLVMDLLLAPVLAFGQESCGDVIPSLDIFEKISQYSIGFAAAFMILGVLIDHKLWKRFLFIFMLLPIAGWAYVNFFIDYAQLKRDIFNRNSMAEATLANIAEAQDRYKSEQGTYIGDLRKIYSHIGGAGGMNECVKILYVKAGLDHWRAEASHVASPNTVVWDSRAGTSLKKG